jgi:hypothetical protein
MFPFLRITAYPLHQLPVSKFCILIPVVRFTKVISFQFGYVLFIDENHNTEHRVIQFISLCMNNIDLV